MKKSKIIALTLVVTSTLVTSSVGFAATESTTQTSNTYQKNIGANSQRSDKGKNSDRRKNFDIGNKGFGLGHGPAEFGVAGRPSFDANVDPLKRLEDEKTNINQQVKDGKMAQAIADKIIANIDLKIKEQTEFNKMTPQEKKDKLLADFTAQMSKFVLSTKVTQVEADKILADYKTKLDSWDGTGVLPFGKAGMMGHKEGMGSMGKIGATGAIGPMGQKGPMDPLKGAQMQKDRINEEVKAGKITQADADKMIAKIDAKTKEMQDFNNLPLQGKKDKLLSDFTAKINLEVTATKITQVIADKEIVDFKAKLDNWDGTGMPFFKGTERQENGQMQAKDTMQAKGKMQSKGHKFGAGHGQ